MTLAVVTMSHSPLLEYNDPAPEVKAEVDAAFAAARGFVTDYDPSLVVTFAPDHYNGFFYDLMPPFCIGYKAEGVGDYGTAAGPLDVPTETAEKLAEWVAERDLDVAISRKMEIDHGAVQPLEILLGGIDTVPTIPIFINGVAKPFTRMARVRRLGEAIGSFLASMPDERILLVGSGGLSHDPPVPQWATASEPQREMLLNGRHPTAAARDARQERVIQTGRDFAAGTSTIQDLAPEWDRSLMKVFASGDLSPIDAMDPTQMAKEAGNSAHEVRTWVAAFAALSVGGAYQVDYEYYRPIKEYIAGFGVMAARTAS